MKRRSSVFFFIFALLVACGTPTPQVTPQIVNAYISSAAGSWTGELYNCASTSTVINLSVPQSADIIIRLGVPENLATPSFQISTEDILIIVHPKSGVSSLTRDQVRSIFLGQAVNWKELGGNDLPVQVWSFSPDEDVQSIFSREVMGGQPVTSTARLAASGTDMVAAIAADPGSVGILPRRLATEEVQIVFTAAVVPVLAITRTQPVGVMNELINCLQQEKH